MAQAAAVAKPPAPPRRRRASATPRRLPYLLIAPAALLMLGFIAYPVISVFYYSLQNYNPTKPWRNGYAGFDNFVQIFTKDPQGGAVTATGKVHLYAAAVSCLSLPLAGWILGHQHRAHPAWGRFAAWSRRLSLGAIPFYLPFIIPFAVNVVFGGHLPTVGTGLVERLMLALEIGLLVLLGVWASSARRA